MYAKRAKWTRKKNTKSAQFFVPEQKSGEQQRNDFIDNRPETAAQGRIKKIVNNSQRISQFDRKKKKGASIGKTMRKSGAANVISSMFIQQHMGNYKTAQSIARKRAGTIPGSCHVISIGELSSIYSEIKSREAIGYHALAGNRQVNPATGNNQFVTAKSYKIFEFGYDSRSRVKKGKTITKRFYYDAIPNGTGGFILHHFDGVV